MVLKNASLVRRIQPCQEEFAAVLLEKFGVGLAYIVVLAILVLLEHSKTPKHRSALHVLQIQPLLKGLKAVYALQEPTLPKT